MLDLLSCHYSLQSIPPSSGEHSKIALISSRFDLGQDLSQKMTSFITWTYVEKEEILCKFIQRWSMTLFLNEWKFRTPSWSMYNGQVTIYFYTDFHRCLCMHVWPLPTLHRWRREKKTPREFNLLFRAFLFNHPYHKKGLYSVTEDQVDLLVNN